MSGFGFPDDLTLPFLFVPHGYPEGPEVEEFKTRYPGWFSIPATFVPYAELEPPSRHDARPAWDGSGGRWDLPPSEPPKRQRSPGSDEPAAVRAFERATALHGGALAGYRALRGSPEQFADPPAVRENGFNRHDQGHGTAAVDAYASDDSVNPPSEEKDFSNEMRPSDSKFVSDPVNGGGTPAETAKRAVADENSKGWVYRQSTGELTHDGKHIATGYSGKAEAKNNPEMQDVENKGPIPQGVYTMGHEYHGPRTGPKTIALTPFSGTNTWGRTEFRVHGDDIAAPGRGSEGCIVLPPAVRDRLDHSPDRMIKVVP